MSTNVRRFFYKILSTGMFLVWMGTLPALGETPFLLGYVGGLTAETISGEAQQSLRALQLAIAQQNLKGGVLVLQ
jgi:hypothetical protein